MNCSFGSPSTDTRLCKNAMNANLASAARLQAPLRIGEDGGCKGAAVSARVVRSADAAGMGWIHWAWKSTHQYNTSGIDSCDSLFYNDADLATLNQAKADVVSEPYPIAIAGTPSAYGFDPSTDTFSLTYKPDPSIKTPTGVFIAPRHYPNGYRIHIRGQHLRSPPWPPY